MMTTQSIDDPKWQYPECCRTINVLNSQPWQGWCEIEMCKKCGKGPFSVTFEVNWETRDEKKQQFYCSDMCRTCLYDLCLQDPDYYDPAYLIKFENALKQRGIYPAYGAELVAKHRQKP